MGCWDSFCCFCSGPLINARDDWIMFLTEGAKDGKWPPGDGEWYNKPGYPVPSLPLEEIVTISNADAKSWDQSVSVTPNSPDFVSPPCTVGFYGDVAIAGVKDKLHLGSDLFLLMHPTCLSFLCRHTSITPRELWESFYKEKSCYQMYGGELNGLLYCVDYYDMQERCGQTFQYAQERHWPPVDRPDLPRAIWRDPKSMEDAKWLLARPTRLPTPKILRPSSVNSSAVEWRKVFDTNELFDIILSYIVDIPTDVLKHELEHNNGNRSHELFGHVNKSGAMARPRDVFEAPSAITAAQTLLSLAQVDRWFHDAIIFKRQAFFLRALRNFGWMLPFTPADWADNRWAARILTNASSLRRDEIDWRQYMLTCVRKEDPNVRSRWRCHRMAIQFARGTNKYRSEEHPEWFWNAGHLGFKTSLEKPKPEGWELYSLYLSVT